MLKSISKNWITMVIIAVSIIIYELLTDIYNILDTVLFPGLSRIIPAMIESLPELGEGLLSSTGLLIPSYFLALTLGIVIGLTVGLYEPLRKSLTPIFHGLKPIPPTLYIPYAIALFPTFWYSSSFIIFVGSFWPILTATIHGVVLIENRYLDNAKALGLKGWKLLIKIIFPASLPTIFNGAGTALVFSFILLTVAEMFGVKSGLGYFIQYYADFSAYDKVLAGLIFMSCYITMIMTCFDMIKNRVLHWTLNR